MKTGGRGGRGQVGTTQCLARKGTEGGVPPGTGGTPSGSSRGARAEVKDAS